MVYQVHGFTGEDSVRSAGVHLVSATLAYRFHRIDERTAGRDHVVHDHRAAAANVAHHVEHLGHVGSRPGLGDDGQPGAHASPEVIGPSHAAGIRRDDDNLALGLQL